MQISSSKRIRFGCFVFLIAFAMMALSFASTISARADDMMLESSTDEIVNVGWLGEVYSWNPLNVEMPEDYVMSHLMYSMLFTYDQDYEGLVLDLATGYSQVVDDQTGKMTTYINITEHAYFRNYVDPNDTSHPLTAEDVVFTLNLIMDNGGAYAIYLKDIDNITATGPYSLSMDTPYAKGTLIDCLADIPIVPEYIWQTYSNPTTMTMYPQNLVGSGPFMFESYLPGAWYKFDTAPNYHGTADYGAERTVSIDGIAYTTHDSAIELAYAMNAGEEDCIVMTGEPNLYLNVLEETATVRKAAVRENGICDVAINAIPLENRTSTYGTGFELLLDPILREALLMCLDKNYIQTDITWDLAQQANSVIQPGYWHIDPVPEIPYDPAAARALLEANGYSDEDGNGYLECRVTDTTDWRHDYYGEELEGIRCDAPITDNSYYQVAQLWEYSAKEAGIGLVAAQKSEGVMVSAAWYKADYDLWVWHWGWGPEPLSTLSCWLTETMKPGGDNCQMPMGPYEDYVNEELNLDLTYTYDGSIYDQVWYLAGRTMDMGERQQLVYLLQQWVYDSRCEYPPYYDVGLYAYSTANFDNWGDLSSHPGLNMMSDLPWIWFNVKPADNRAPIYESGLENSYIGKVDSSIFFSITVSDADGDVLDVTFDFGDGTTTQCTLLGDTTVPTVVTVNNAYDAVGVYDLSVSLTDNYIDPVTGPRDPIVRTSVVEVVSDLNAVPVIWTAGIDDPPPANVGHDTIWSIGASDAESDVYGLRITWDWDDGTYDVCDVASFPSNEIGFFEAVHAWSEAGTYHVEISVWDCYGLESGEHNVSISTDYSIEINQPPEGPYISNISAVPGIPELCYASSYDTCWDLLKFTWEWDDGTYTTDEVYSNPYQSAHSSVVHTWLEEGTYPVTVYVDDGEYNVSAMTTAVVSVPMNPPNVWFSVNPGIGTTSTYFILDPSYTWDYEDPYSALVGRWDFEADGVWDTEYESLDIRYVQYDTVGFKNILLEVMDTSGQTAIGNNTLIVDDLAPIADAGPDASISVGAMYTFDGTGSSDDFSVSHFRWSFVYDGYTRYLYGPTPSFVFEIEGVYVVTLTVWDVAGKTDTDTMVLTVSDAIYVVKDSGSSRDSMKSWHYTPSESGAWISWIENHGLRSLTIEIYDVSDQPVLVAEMKIRFSEFDAYPTGIIWTSAVPMDAYKTYLVVVTPQGNAGTYAILNQKFVAY